MPADRMTAGRPAGHGGYAVSLPGTAPGSVRDLPFGGGGAYVSPQAVAEGSIAGLFRGGAREDGAAQSGPGAETAPAGPAPGGRFWQIDDKYIIVPTGDGIMIVDQHAAHERVIYEKTVRRFESMEKRTQELLFPQAVELTPSDAALVRELAPLLEGLGFSIKMFGPNTVIVEGVPPDLRPGYETTILRDVIGLFREDESRVKLDPRKCGCSH